MKLKLIITLCLAAALFISCQKSEKYEIALTFSLKDFKITTKLNAKTIEFDEPVMKPLLFVLSDSLLIAQNIRTEYTLYAYNINSKKKIGEYVPWGNGPNELLRIKSMQIVDSDLYIADNQRNIIYKYDINDFHKLTSPVPMHKVEIEDIFTSLAYTDNGYVATTLNPRDKRLVFYNSKGEKEYTTGEYPYYGKELSDVEKMEGFLSSIAVSPKHKRIYLFGMDTDLIEIYDFKGVLIKRLHGPEQFFPQIKEINLGDGYSKATSDEEAKFAFFNPIIMEDEIYVSYSGKPQKRDEEAAPINHILVFDKDCNPIRRYELSKPILKFAIDSKTKNFYAICNIPDYQIITFEQ